MDPQCRPLVRAHCAATRKGPGLLVLGHPHCSTHVRDRDEAAAIHPSYCAVTRAIAAGPGSGRRGWWPRAWNLTWPSALPAASAAHRVAGAVDAAAARRLCPGPSTRDRGPRDLKVVTVGPGFTSRQGRGAGLLKARVQRPDSESGQWPRHVREREWNSGDAPEQ